MLTWYEKQKTLWHFYFKFKRLNQDMCPFTDQSRKANKKDDLLNGFSDINCNQESGCVILEVYSLHFISMPVVMGLILKKVYMNVSQGMRHHKLKLHFSSLYSSCDKTKVTDNDDILIMDPVVNMKVVNWWDQRYQIPSRICQKEQDSLFDNFSHGV